jgi:hypothetical protein
MRNSLDCGSMAAAVQGSLSLLTAIRFKKAAILSRAKRVGYSAELGDVFVYYHLLPF